MTCQVETESELLQILALQEQNHFASISTETKNSEGFVTVKHNLELLRKMNEKAKQVIAIENGKVIGYALVMTKDFKELIPLLVPMFDSFEHIAYKGKNLSQFNYYVMGQVCIAESHRGKGVFAELYAMHKEAYGTTFELCITEISTNNPRSLKAHQKVGFRTIHTYSDEWDEWNIVVWDWSI